MNENELKLKAELSKLLASWKPEMRVLDRNASNLDIIKSSLSGKHFCEVALAWESVYGERLCFEEQQAS